MNMINKMNIINAKFAFQYIGGDISVIFIGIFTNHIALYCLINTAMKQLYKIFVHLTNKCDIIINNIIFWFRTFAKSTNEALRDKQEEAELLEERKDKLEHKMANPRRLNKNAKNLEEVEKEEKLLEELAELSKDPENDNSADALQEYKEHLKDELSRTDRSARAGNSRYIEHKKDKIETAERLQAKELYQQQEDSDISSTSSENEAEQPAVSSEQQVVSSEQQGEQPVSSENPSSPREGDTEDVEMPNYLDDID